MKEEAEKEKEKRKEQQMKVEEMRVEIQVLRNSFEQRQKTALMLGDNSKAHRYHLFSLYSDYVDLIMALSAANYFQNRTRTGITCLLHNCSVSGTATLQKINI